MILREGTRLRLDRIEDHLGPAEARFFGAGHRRSVFEHGDLRTVEGVTRGVVAVSYPADWSAKGRGDLRPHLSTVDALVLATDLADALLASELGLEPDERRAARVVKVVVQAGTTPDEDLRAVPLAAWITKSNSVEPGLVETTVRASVGALRLRLVIRHGRPGGALESADHARHDGTAPGEQDPRSRLEAGPRRLWGTGFRQGHQSLTRVVVDLADSTARAELAASTLPVEVSDGLEGAPAGVTRIDALVSILQLVQVLLYEMDDIARADSDTLWMQQVTIESAREGSSAVTDASRPLRFETTVEARITQADLLDLPHGSFRNVAFVGSAGAHTLRAVFAHRLPESGRPLPSDSNSPSESDPS